MKCNKQNRRKASGSSCNDGSAQTTGDQCVADGVCCGTPADGAANEATLGGAVQHFFVPATAGQPLLSCPSSTTNDELQLI